MAVEGLILREWISDSARTDNFSFVTKFTDLGTPDTYKSITGYYCNVSQDFRVILTPSSTDIAQNTSNSAAYTFSLDYRLSPRSPFDSLGIIHNSFSDRSGQTSKELNYVYTIPPFKAKNIQLRIRGIYITPGFGINDFGIIYRTIRDSSVSKHDED